MKKPKDLQTILERIKGAEDWRDTTYKDKWTKALCQYRSIPPVKKADRSNIFVPQTFMMVETVKSRTFESLFATRPFVTALPRGNDDALQADAVQSLLDWQFNERMNLKRLFAEDVLPDATIFGTVVVYTGWQKKERTIRGRRTERTPLLDNFGAPFLDEFGQPIYTERPVVVEETVTVYDDPLTQRVDIFDFYVDKTATNIQDARFCGHVEWLTKEQIKHYENTAGWDVKWKDLSPVQEMTGGKEIRAEVTGGGTLAVDDSYDKNSAGGLYEVVHYWEDNRHMVIINRQECALDEKNPFWHGMKPYDKCCYVPLTNEFYGIGIPEIISNLQDELNTSRNQRIDYNSMALRRMWKMRKGCGLTAQDLVWRQNGVIQLDEMDDVQEIFVEKLPASAFANEETIKQDMRDATGVHDIILGLADADETATTTMTKDNNASIRFKFFIESLVDDILLPIASKCFSMNIQFMEGEKVVRLFDSDEGKADAIRSITIDDITGDYDFYYVGSSVEPMANKEIYKNKVLEVYQLAMANPFIQQNPESQRKLLLELFKAAEIKDPSSFVPDQPIMPAQPQGLAAPNNATGTEMLPMFNQVTLR